MSAQASAAARPAALTARTAAAVLVLVLTAAACLYGVAPAQAAITRDFTTTFSVNTNGAIVLRGNANLTCDSAQAGCAAARNRTGTGTAANNNGFRMKHVDIDADATTFNSSSADLVLPAGSSVLFAGLYWSGDTRTGTGTAPPDAAASNRVRFAVPGGGYRTVTATEVSTASNSGHDVYQGYADVTDVVAGAGNGTYTVANIQSATDVDDRYAGWALVTVYGNPAEPIRNMVVYDGFGIVQNAAGDTTLDIPVGGFQTPPTGAVATRLGAVVYEGDMGSTGDEFRLNGTALSDAQNVQTNFFNSTVSELGAAIGARNPSYANLLGVDIDRVDASGILGNNVRTARITLTTGGETVYPGVITFSTDLYSPKLTGVKSATDLDGGVLEPGDEIEYRVEVENEGNDRAVDSVVSDAVPSGATYVPGSLRVDATPVTDAAGDDRGEFRADSAQGRVVFRVGAGAGASTGGGLARDETASVSFRVRVDAATPGDFTVLNVANLGYRGEQTGLVLNGPTNVIEQPVVAPTADLVVTGAGSPASVQRGGADDPVDHDFTVVNRGPDPEPDAVLTTTLPAGVDPGSAVASQGGTCTVTGRTVTCPLGALAVGATATVRVTATVTATAPTAAAVTATATGSGVDPAAANSAATVTTVVNRAPVAADDAAATASGTPVSVPVLADDTDPDGHPLVVTAVTAPGDGAVVINEDGTLTYTPDAGFAGDDTVTYTVGDGRGGTDTADVVITVANAAPTAAADEATGAEGQPVVVDVLANDTDRNADPLTVTATGTPAGGTVVVNPDGTLTFTSDLGVSGPVSFTYTASDGRGGTDTATVTVIVTGVTGPPVAADDTVTTAYDTPVVTDVRDNDRDPDGDPLAVTSLGAPVDAGGVTRGSASVEPDGRIAYDPPAGFSGTVTFDYTLTAGADTATGTVTVVVRNAAPSAVGDAATAVPGTPLDIAVTGNDTDPDGGTPRVVGVGTPGNGRVARLPGGAVRYVADPGFTGTDTFTYTVGDDDGGTDTATVTVTVPNAPPVAAGDARTIEPAQPVTVPVLANDTDANGDSLTISSFDAVSADGGTVTAAGAGQLRYVPGPGFAGTDTFTYRVSDGNGGTDTATVTITLANTAPTAAVDAVTTPTDTAVTLDVRANDTDAAGDPLTVTGFTNGGAGTVTVLPAGVRYEPDAGFSGVDTFTYTVSDGDGGFDTVTVTVTVLNAPPVARPDTLTVTNDRPATLPVLANDTDANGHALRIVGVTTPSTGTAAIRPDGSLRYTAPAGYTGGATLIYTVGDGNGGTDTATVTITVTANAAPVATDDTGDTGTGVPVTVPVLANDTDPDGDTLRVTAVTAPAHGTATIPPDERGVVYRPAAGYAGGDTFTYTVTDAGGLTDTAAVTVDVANAAPVAVDDVASTPSATPVAVDVLSNDSDADSGQTLTLVGIAGPPVNGTATAEPDGTVTYTPDAGFKGTDTFTYTVGDGTGATATGTVTVTVSDAAPVANADYATTA